VFGIRKVQPQSIGNSSRIPRYIRKLGSFVLSMVLLLQIFAGLPPLGTLFTPPVVGAAAPTSDLIFQEETGTIIGWNYSGEETVLIIPDQINGVDVVAIDIDAIHSGIAGR